MRRGAVLCGSIPRKRRRQRVASAGTYATARSHRCIHKARQAVAGFESTTGLAPTCPAGAAVSDLIREASATGRVRGGHKRMVSRIVVFAAINDPIMSCRLIEPMKDGKAAAAMTSRGGGEGGGRGTFPLW
jgi:hypothetical protein